MENKLNILREKIAGAKNIAIVGHKNPDGDALGSVLAMSRLIEINFEKRATCIYDGNIPDALDAAPLRSHMHHIGRINPDTHFDLMILMDCGSLQQVEYVKPQIENADFTIEIDHHKNDAPIADLCIDDDTAVATAEILYEIIRADGWKMDMDIANLLAIAILTDTGFFRYTRRSNILNIMAQLVDYGVNMGRLYDLLSGRPRSTILVETGAVANAEFLYKNRLAVATINMRDYRKLDGRGSTLLELLQNINGVDYVVLLKQQKENQIGVSLRSRRRPINDIAVALGGGGHEYAAGAVVEDTLENVRKRVVELFRGII